MRRWEEVFSGTDRKLLEMSGMGRRQVYGMNPVLLVIDVTKRFLGPNKPILEAVRESRVACGEAGWKCLPNIKMILEACRGHGIPVIFAIPDTATRQRSGMLQKGRKLDQAAKEDFVAEEIIDDIAPLRSELIVPKIRASIFFGTPLASCLRAMQADTLLITGTTTSGCVRAAAVDGYSYGFQCVVVEECTFDRFELSHLVNLFDINAKYADVITLEEALTYIEEVAKSKKETAKDV